MVRILFLRWLVMSLTRLMRRSKHRTSRSIIIYQIKRLVAKILLARMCLPYMMKAFAKGWRDNEPRRRAFVANLTAVIKRHVMYAFSSSVLLDDYDEEADSHSFDPYWAAQVTLAGVQFGGERFRGFVEAGAGMQGLVLAGLSVSF